MNSSLRLKSSLLSLLILTVLLAVWQIATQPRLALDTNDRPVAAFRQAATVYYLTFDGATWQAEPIPGAGGGIALAGAAPCPSCGEKALVREEGCWKCQACGYAKCG